MLDVDFVPSPNAAGALARAARTLPSRTALVVPAFEPTEEGTPLPSAKSQTQNTLRQFHGLNFAQGHAATDYPRWHAATAPYGIEYANGFEPYVVLAAADDTPMYEERFVGRGYNKVSHVWTLNEQGWAFAVAADAWIVHVDDGETGRWPYSLMKANQRRYTEYRNEVRERAEAAAAEETPTDAPPASDGADEVVIEAVPFSTVLVLVLAVVAFFKMCVPFSFRLLTPSDTFFSAFVSCGTSFSMLAERITKTE